MALRPAEVCACYFGLALSLCLVLKRIKPTTTAWLLPLFFQELELHEDSHYTQLSGGNSIEMERRHTLPAGTPSLGTRKSLTLSNADSHHDGHGLLGMYEGMFSETEYEKLSQFEVQI